MHKNRIRFVWAPVARDPWSPDALDPHHQMDPSANTAPLETSPTYRHRPLQDLRLGVGAC